jgi:hypothetical protein
MNETQGEIDMTRKAYRRREERRPRARGVPDSSLGGADLGHRVSDVAASDLDLRLWPSAVLTDYFPLRERVERE